MGWRALGVGAIGLSVMTGSSPLMAADLATSPESGATPTAAVPVPVAAAATPTAAAGPAAGPAAPDLPQAQPAAIPPSIVEQVLQQILVERDLEAAQKLLTGSLAHALNQVENPAWTARIYALLSAVSTLEGDAEHAHRMALRAVALDNGVRLEPQLGESANATLSAARKEWKARDADASASFSDLSPSLDLYVDGIALELPGSRSLKAGDHLVQVNSSIGVVARAWITLAPGEQVSDPRPIDEVKQALAPRVKEAPITPEELDSLLDGAHQAQSAIQEMQAGLEVEIEVARAGRKLEIIGCLAEQGQAINRLSESARQYNERLQGAQGGERGDERGDEIRHLFQMIGLARDEALRHKEAIDACQDRLERGAPVQVRVLQAPPPAPLTPVRLESGSSSAEARVPLARVPESSPRHVLLRPPPADLWEASMVENAPDRAGPGAMGSKMADKGRQPSPLRGQLEIDAVYDSNPLRTTPDIVAALRQVGAAPALYALITPQLALEGPVGSIRARYPLLLGRERQRLTDFETVAQVRLAQPGDAHETAVGLGLEVRRDTFPVDELGAGFGELQRTGGQARLSIHTRPAGAFQTELTGEGRLDRIDWLGAGSSNLRLSYGAGLSTFWRIYPFSVLAADFAVGGWNSTSSVDPGQQALLDDDRSAWFTRLRLGVEGALAPGVVGEVRVGPGLYHVTAEDQGELLDLSRALGGFARLRYERGGVILRIELERTLAPVFFADASLVQDLRLGIETGGVGRLSLRGSVRGGLEQLYRANRPWPATGMTPSNPDASATPAGWWPSQPFVGGDFGVRWRVGSSRSPLTLSATWLPTVRWGVPLGPVGTSATSASATSTTAMVDQQVFLGASGGF